MSLENTDSMRRELKYFLSILSIFSVTIYFLSILLKKYATFTFEHLWQNCKVVASNLFSSGAHYVGFVLTVFILIVTLGFFLKTLLSYVKTQNKLNKILESRIFSIPKKLKIILERNDIKPDSLVIVKDEKEYALTIDWFSPKIVVSSNMIAKLSRKQLEAVILHEYYHLKNKHPLLLITSEILSSSLLFLPVLRDLTRKLRTVLEQEADKFVSSQQKTVKHLNLALSGVKSDSLFNLYPSFSKRNDYDFRKSSLFISILFFLIGLFLFKFPVESYALQPINTSNLPKCGEGFCSVHCVTDDFNEKPNMSYAFQTSLSSFITID